MPSDMRSAKAATKAEYGTANLKKVDRIEQRENLLEAKKLEKQAERKQRWLQNPKAVSAAMDRARKDAVSAYARAPMSGQDAELARTSLALDPQRVAEMARQSSRGQAEAQAKEAVEAGQAAAGRALDAHQAMLAQLEARGAAARAAYGKAPVTWGEQLGRGVAEQAVSGAIKGVTGGAGALGVTALGKTLGIEDAEAAKLALASQTGK